MSVKHIYVVGSGTMGNGIAQTAAVSGFSVTMMDVDAAQLERGSRSIDSRTGATLGSFQTRTFETWHRGSLSRRPRGHLARGAVGSDS